MTIGERLKRAREEKGFTLKDVQEKIKIRTKYLEAIEEEKYDVIPGEAYIKAFIKGYASHLGLDADELLKEYEQKIEEERNQKEVLEIEEENKTVDFLHNKIVLSSIIVIVVLVVLAFIIYSIFLLNDSRSEISDLDNNSLVLQVNGELNADEGSENRNISGQELTAETEEFTEEIAINDKGERKTIKVIASEKTWLQVFVDGEEKFEGILEMGDTEYFNGYKTLQMKIGNAIGITIEKGNEVLGPWGKSGEVITKVVEF